MLGASGAGMDVSAGAGHYSSRCTDLKNAKWLAALWP